MALGNNERQRSAVPVQDLDGRLIVVGPNGVPIAGGAGGGGADPLSDGDDAGALPTKTLWIAGADGAVLRGIRVDASGRLRTVLEGTPAVSVSNFPVSQPVTGPLTDVQLRASNVPVSGPLTDTQLRAAAVPVSGAFFQATQPVSGPLTDVQLRASAVPVSGPLTDTQLRASAVPVTDSRLPAALDADGGMKVHVQNPSAGGGGGASQADKSAFVEGTTVFTPMGGVLNEAITADPTEDQAAAARITPKRAVHSNLRNNSGAEIGIAAAPVRTDPTGTTTQPVSGTVNIGTAPQVAVNNVETLVDNAGFTDGTSKLFPQGYIFDDVAGTALTENDVAAARIDSKRAQVNIIEDGTTRGQKAVVTVQGALLNAGDTAHDGVDAGNPVKTGAKASWPAVPALVASADRTNNWSDLAGAQVVRMRPIPMYTARFRLANATAGNRVLTASLVANTNKQVATIYHAATAARRVALKYVSVDLQAISGTAGLMEMELVPLSATTAPAGGTPAITPGKHDQADPVAEATCLAMPTTQGSVVNADAPVGDDYAQGVGVTGAGSTANPPPPPTRVVLWDSRTFTDGKDLIMRLGVAEGYAVVIRSQAATNPQFTVTIQFTEE